MRGRITRIPNLTPYLPARATLDSAFVVLALLRYQRKISLAKKNILGRYYTGNAAQYGHLVSRVGKQGIPEYSTEHLLLKNTAWPVYSSLMEAPLAHESFVCAVNGRHTSRYFYPRNQGLLFASSWRWCSQCREEDMGQSGPGVPHWRTIHQLPGITHCPYHGSALEYCCLSCGASVGSPRQCTLPGDSCECGCSNTAHFAGEATSGECALANLYSRLLDGSGERFDTATRRELLAERQVGSSDLMSAFGCSDLADLGKKLWCTISNKSLDACFRGGELASAPPVLHLATAAVALISPVKVPTHQPQLFKESFSEATEDNHAKAIEIQVLSYAADSRVSEVAVRALLGGSTIAAIARARLSNAVRMRKFLMSMPETLRRELKFESHRQRVRRQLLSLITSGLRRAQLIKISSRAYLWSKRNDSDWLDSACPRQTPGPRKRL